MLTPLVVLVFCLNTNVLISGGSSVSVTSVLHHKVVHKNRSVPFSNIGLIFLLLSMIGATLTLPGIAGIVLTIGMAVDANVLIFERIREELKTAKGPARAIELGYEKALSAIIDANITTFLTASILFVMGAGPVKGFAITLGLGIITSVFTAIFVTRIMIVIWFEWRKPKTLEV